MHRQSPASPDTPPHHSLIDFRRSDKYTQISRILTPILTTLREVERLCKKDREINKFIKTSFGGVSKLQKDILHDFFTRGFDGAGALDYFAAGSCIDGRLTRSAWHGDCGAAQLAA